MQTIAPTFSLEPPSSSAQPLSVQPGQTLVLQATVVNPTHQVDHVRLTCAGWPEDWFTVAYPPLPEGGSADSLGLDPGEENTLAIALSPPPTAQLGDYEPVIRLVSANDPDLTLVARVHLQVGPLAALPEKPAFSQRQIVRLSRPWWQLLLALLAGLGVLGVLAWLLWWLFLRPSRPHIVEFFLEKPVYLASNQEVPAVSWEIANPGQIQTLKLTAYDREGRTVSGPVSYDLSQALPEALAPFCTTLNRLLSCQNVPTDARQPGEYRFELTLIPKDQIDQASQVQTSSLITVQGLPLPTVAELVPTQIRYSEVGATPSPSEPNFIPPVTSTGITLNWVITNPTGLQDVLLVVREGDGTVLGGRRYSLRQPAQPQQLILPKELQPFCQVRNVLVCQNVPTGIGEVGKYTFEVTAVPLGQPATPPTPKKTELVQIQPRPARIAAFQIDGREAQPRYLIPVDQGQPLPRFVLSWQVVGGSTTRVVLLPSPGTVPLQGSAPVPLNPNGETTITLQVGNGADPPLVRSVTITTFDPTPDNPEIAAAAARAAQAAQAAAAAAAQAAQARPQPQAEGPATAPLDPPAATEPDRLTPAEGAPRLD